MKDLDLKVIGEVALPLYGILIVKTELFVFTVLLGLVSQKKMMLYPKPFQLHSAIPDLTFETMDSAFPPHLGQP